MKVYLAGPINGCSDVECKGWRDQAKRFLACEVFDPMVRDYRGQEQTAFSQIVEQDKADIDAADIVLVMYEKPSVGTSMEILYAWERGKQIYLVHGKCNSLSPWLVYHSHKFFPSLKGAVDFINESLALSARAGQAAEAEMAP